LFRPFPTALRTSEEIGRAALFILHNDYYDGRNLEIDGGCGYEPASDRQNNFSE
jgi:hypothetical protein